MFSALLGVLFLLIFLQSLIGCYFLLICPPFCFVVFCCNCCCCFFCVCFRVRLLFSHLNTFACLSHLHLATDKTVNQDHPMHFFPAACIMIINSCIERKQIEEQLHDFFDSGKIHLLAQTLRQNQKTYLYQTCHFTCSVTSVYSQNFRLFHLLMTTILSTREDQYLFINFQQDYWYIRRVITKKISEHFQLAWVIKIFDSRNGRHVVTSRGYQISRGIGIFQELRTKSKIQAEFLILEEEVNLRSQGHNFILPRIRTERFKQTFINRYLLSFIQITPSFVFNDEFL